MFRTARGFMVIVPLAFLASLVAFLVTHGKAAESFTPYPFLLESLGQGLAKHPAARFALVTSILFLIPYVVSSILLFLADAGLEAAERLWRQPAAAGRKKVAHLPPEGRWALVAAALGISALAPRYIDRIAKGGELPGGVNIAPLLVAALPFLATGAALVVAGIAIVPRSLASRFTSASGRG